MVVCSATAMDEEDNTIEIKYDGNNTGEITWIIKPQERIKAGDAISHVLLVPETEITIISPKKGRIIQVFFKVGDQVEFGDILATFHISAVEKKYDTRPIIGEITKLCKERTILTSKKTKNPLPAIQQIDEKILENRIALLNMYKELKQRESERFDPEYIPFIVTTEMADNYCKYVPKLPLDPRICEKSKVVTSFATEVGKIDNEHCLLNYFHGRSTSTYPYMEYKKQREGEPICDQYRVSLASTHSLIAVADGCNWGRAPATAAAKASKAFIDYMKKNRDLFRNTHRVSRLCLEGLAAAHNAIIEGPYEEGQRIGTTTLLGGLLAKVILPGQEEAPLDTLDDWVFVFASIGDCKAFLWQSRNKRIEELTPDSRGENFLDASDCGGRVGPYIEGGPDMRNLEVFMSPCVTGDTIIVCTDGVHDNFDPQMHGLQPKDLHIDRKRWEDCTPAQANAAKAEWRVNEMKRVVDSENPSVDEMTEKFIQYCYEMNLPAQEFMQQNLGKRLPNDYTQFPGKMDHTTMVTLRVGQIPEAVMMKENNKRCQVPLILTHQSEMDLRKSGNLHGSSSLLKRIHSQSPKGNCEKRLIHQSSDSSISAIRRTKSETPVKDDDLRSMSKRKSSSMLGVSFSHLSDGEVATIQKLYRRLTRLLRQISTAITNPQSESFQDIEVIQAALSKLEDDIVALMEVVRSHEFEENISALEKGKHDFISCVRDSYLDKEHFPDCHKIFDKHRKVLLMEFKIIRQLAAPVD